MTQYDNKIILAAAGSGKTTRAARIAASDRTLRTLVISYTQNSKREIEERLFLEHGCIPSRVKVRTWYSFLLSHFIRPYQNYLYERRINSINFNRIPDTLQRVNKSLIKRYYISGNDRIWSDRASDFACALINKTSGLPVQRAESIFERIIIDEAQDLAGWDLELINHLLLSKIQIILIGDHRQAIYTTNDNRKHSNYRGEKIINIFNEWHKKRLLQLEKQSISFRCIQEICDVADRFFPDDERTVSKNCTKSDHDGVFLVRNRDVNRYYQKYRPQTLHWSKTKEYRVGNPINFGDSKGMTFHRVLIYPHEKLLNFIETGNMNLEGATKTKSYVAFTRARQSVAIVVPNDFNPSIGMFFEFEE